MSKWNFEFTIAAEKQFFKLDKTTKKQIQKFMNKVIKSDSPRSFAKPLQHDLKNMWRYRIGNYRMVCQFQNDIFTITTIHIAHRKVVYN